MNIITRTFIKLILIIFAGFIVYIHGYGCTEDKFSQYTKGTHVTPQLLKAVMVVESNGRNVIGDKHLENKAYGYFQIRQPAVDDVNKIFGINIVSEASELLEDVDAQIIYVTLYLHYLINHFQNEEKV